ncbi:FAD-dependent oxidoreductase [Sphingosinicella microcystinivorans]|uniref:FAD-dependent oxidoreductase n=1 Tax=Sphingosinicella microcystinivorans TaxID=335406 RepID=A0AAD1G0Y3_SPHMI|nr:glycine/D-amino acid oxidase-like deaminating enzyme [Sphingosinicella microcystinivorans]BBE34139.1 FAD-dependent oxidoreductase [Sphingosinicella microcystinivorans]
MELTEARDLRGGRTCWVPEGTPSIVSDPPSKTRVDIAIVGAGIMGAMLAERLSAAGRRVVVLDRRPPAHGSTAASTALVMWGADVPLTHLAERLGIDEAARRWKRVHAAARRLSDRIDALGIACGRIDRPELYLAGTLLDERALDGEGEARRKAGLPSEFLAADAVAARFGVAPRAALLSADSYEVDPVKLTEGLLALACRHGAEISFPYDAVAVEQQAEGLAIRTAEGPMLLAKEVILATGYERARWYLPAAYAVRSSYAIATPPATAPLWRENAMIWEASDPYIYARATSDGRIVAGGEDEDFDDADRRDTLIGAKAGILQAKTAAIIGTDPLPPDCAWAAAFGSSPDGLPAIGRAVNHDHLWLASGFGGNGVTFAALATELITAALDGTPDPDASCFDPYRFE